MVAQSVFGPDVTQIADPTGNKRIPIGSSATGPKEFVTPDQIAALALGGTTALEGWFSVKETPGNAAGNGVADDTSAIQAVIDAAPEGAVIYFPVGIYSVNRLNVPFQKSLSFVGASVQGSVLRSRSVGIDIFHSDRGTGNAQDRFTTQHFYKNLRLELNLPENGPDTAPNFNRCTIEGLAVGCAAIAYETSALPSSATPGQIAVSWPNTFGRAEDIIVQAIDTNDGGRMNSCAVFISGSAYGWDFMNFELHDISHGYVETAPFIRRCTVNTSSNTLSHSGGTYPSNAQLTVAQHSAEGSLASGVTRFSDYFARNSSSGSLQLSTSAGGGAVNISSAGTADFYIYARDQTAVVVAPDGSSIINWTQYGGRSVFNLSSPENKLILRSDSYQISVSLLACRAFPNSSRPFGLTNNFICIYSESPQGQATPPNQARDPFVIMEGRVVNVNGLQIRGAEQGTGRPRIEFSSVFI